MNKKIMDFNKDWYQCKQSSFATILRSIVDAFYENACQYKDVFKDIIEINNTPKDDIPKLRSKKSIILESPLLPINEFNKMRSSLKKSVSNLEDSDAVVERNEKTPENSKKLSRKTAFVLQDPRENYSEFNDHLKSLNIDVEDEHLKDLDEGEIVHTFKLVFQEMSKKFEEYKAKLNDSLKFYKEIKEVYFEDLIEGKEIYMNSLLELLNTKFNKTFSKKTGNYLKLFEMAIQKLRDYAENFRNYLKVHFRRLNKTIIYRCSKK